MIKPLVSYLFFAVDLLKGKYHSSNGREERLLEHIKATVPAGQPQAVLDAIDKYAHSQEFFMNVGDGKGGILLQEMDKLPSPPKAVLELGTYCGYSTIMLAAHLTAPGGAVYTVDICEPNVAVARQMIAHAGVDSRVVHVVKPLEQAVEELRAALKAQGRDAFELVFIDHEKSVYLSDLQLLIKEGLIREGSVVVADNLRIPGAPDFVKWIKASPDFDYTEHSVNLGASALWLSDTSAAF